MPLPEIHYCLVCEGVRSEERHKATILGFYNLLPWVELRISEWGIPLPIMFFFGTEGGIGNANFQVRILKADGTELIKTPELKVTFQKGFLKTNIGIGLENLIFPSEGTYTVQLWVSGKQKYQDIITIKNNLEESGGQQFP